MAPVEVFGGHEFESVGQLIQKIILLLEHLVVIDILYLRKERIVQIWRHWILSIKVPEHVELFLVFQI